MRVVEKLNLTALGLGHPMPRLKKTPAFGSALQALREQHPFTQGQLVIALQGFGVKADAAALYNYEYGYTASPDPVTLWGLAKVYDRP